MNLIPMSHREELNNDLDFDSDEAEALWKEEGGVSLFIVAVCSDLKL